MDKDNSSIIEDDVFYISSLLGKKVRVQTIENKFVEGAVFVIDPIHKTVVLSDENKIHILIYLSIKSLEELSKEAVEPSFLNKPAPRDIGDYKNIEERGEKLLNWLTKNFILARKVGENIIIDEHVTISPPYTEETCYCENTIVLERIRDLFGKMQRDSH